MGKYIGYIRLYGIGGFLCLFIQKIRKVLFRRYTTTYYALFKKLTAEIDPAHLPAYRTLTWEDFQAAAAQHPADFDEQTMQRIEQHLQRPEFFYYGVYEENRLLCYAALSLQYNTFLGERNVEKFAYLFDDYTLPPYRGAGWHRKMVAIREYEAKKQGKNVVFAYVGTYNRASLKGFQRAGFFVRYKLTFQKKS